MAWQLNNKLLNGYGFKYVKAEFDAPDITNPDDMMKLLNISERAGGMTLNDARALTKDVRNHDDEVVAVMKEVKKLLNGWLENEADGCIIKEVWSENDHPRDDEGKFSDTGGNSGKAGEESASTGIAYAMEKVSAYIENPKTLGETTHSQKYDDFKAHGVDVKPLGRGTFKGIEYEDGGGYRVHGSRDGQYMQYHPEKHSHHGGAYYKLTSGKTGSRRYDMNGDPAPIEKAEKGVKAMQIDQDKFFDGMDFERYEMNGWVCFKGPDGYFYRIDHFWSYYVIEDAENEEEARINRFEDADLFDDALEESELIRQIQDVLKQYILQ